eukprot:750921-Amphidinium_carterae.1
MKVRFVLDFRRSGVNGMLQVFERACGGLVAVCPLDADGVLPFFMVFDFADAFMSIPLGPQDRGLAVIAVFDGYLVYRRLAVGFAPAPTLSPGEWLLYTIAWVRPCFGFERMWMIHWWRLFPAGRSPRWFATTFMVW